MSRPWDPITLSRDCVATTVPYGEQVTLDEGGEVEIVQQLGTSITVRSSFGTLFRIDGADADALGMEIDTDAATTSVDGPFDMAQVTEALNGVYDPEIPVSIVELGLVYRCDEVIEPDGHRRIEIDMTMTAPGCGMGDVLKVDAERAVRALPGVHEVDVNLVWEPRWTVHHMSEATRLQLGLL